ncbi:murein L,D-transpeptidase catalytic domain family protein [Flavobacterium nackdongense]|uniref:Murein L,D-transpeptidase catalytic domain family protein n=1 Tax=Flavobacterium nackdongense TaxID=2547394 RepID=A0A4P6YED9_9FLAO|nr:murein L,D-transpeptidase catalytic domain family protein [Flavobacterium nackdongense]QBN18783.1 murein L,D-transpeptidase catalytic domain family protein [Flavobacterium nackdongense]
MIYKIFPAALLLLISLYSNKKDFTTPLKSENKAIVTDLNPSSDSNIEITYNKLTTNQFDIPHIESFREALKGFYLLKEKGLVEKNIITLVDFSLSSNTKRLWVIDLETNTVLYNSLVAHGRNTGEEFANRFSNSNSSYQSSLGIYLTGEVYTGKHGMSLKLDGLEKGINDHARARGVVMHSANYVSNSFIKCNKRLGRSQGCPAIPQELLAEIVNTIKNKSYLFIYHPSRSLEKNSPLFS